MLSLCPPVTNLALSLILLSSVDFIVSTKRAVKIFAPSGISSFRITFNYPLEIKTCIYLRLAATIFGILALGSDLSIISVKSTGIALAQAIY